MAAKPGTLLDEYREKRDFTRTSEPSGGSRRARTKALRFVVQKHDATRLHYDFRIELDGVLKSWAVTRGPSANPEDKRLAVRVEDHPLDYASFEGTIPEGEYGGGTVMVWDEGTWEPIGDPHEGLRSGDLKMRLFGQRMQGEWVLVHMKGRDTRRKSGPARQNWLLIKHRDGKASEARPLTERFTRSVTTGRDLGEIAKGVRPKKDSDTPAAAVWHSEPQSEPAPKASPKDMAALPAFSPPQLATLVDTVPEGSNWLFEMKYDGYRCLAALSGKAVRLYTRHGLDWTGKFAALVPALSRLTRGSALIDGEICAFDAKGRTDFSTLKASLASGAPLVLFAFDLLEQDGEDLRAFPLAERKVRLKTLLGPLERASPLQFSDHVRGSGQKVLDALCREGHEGVIAKRADAPYSGRRDRAWLKIKCVKRQEFVIAGWSASQKRRGFASLLVGTWEDGRLIYRGRVGTGFTADEAQAMQARLDALARKTNPFESVPAPIRRGAHWVAPKLVAELAYAEFTPDGILRHPSFIALREDKPAEEVGLEMPMPTKAATAKPEPADGEAIARKLGLHLTSPDRVLFPGQGITKSEIIGYYAAVAERMLPFIARRPLSLLRCPQGRAKYCFFQKHDTGGFPDEMKTLPITEAEGDTEDYFYIEDLAGLVAGTQMNVLEWHIWGSRIADIEKPERLIFDIDPDPGRSFADVKQAALDIAKTLDVLGLKSFPLLSGGKGIHVIVPLKPKAEWPDVKAFCRDVAEKLAQADPERFIATASKAKRKGKLFIDYLRNERGSTAIAPWSIRSREGAPCAVPLAWDELPAINAANQFSLPDAIARAGEPDPWPGYFKLDQVLTKPMQDAVAG